MILRDGVGELARLSALYGRVECLPPELMAAQMLLAAVGIGGDRLVWRPEGADGPRFGKPSTTFLGEDGDRHGWFLRNLKPVVEYQEQADTYLRNPGTRFPKPVELRSLRKRQEKYAAILPKEVECKTHGFEFCHTEFATAFSGKVPKIDGRESMFGRDQLVLVFRRAAYEALNLPTGNGPDLKRAATNETQGLRATLHGWVERRSFRRIARKAGSEDCKVYGWILPSRRFAPPMPNRVVTATTAAVYSNPIALRFLKPMSPYRPSPEIAGLLNRADHDWRAPTWLQGAVFQPLCRAGEELAWQLAAALWILGLDRPRDSRRLRREAELAAGLAAWIRGAHTREVRLLFPGPQENPAEQLSCSVADHLQNKPAKVRDLCRRLRGVKAEQVRSVLFQMKEQGWVEDDSQGYWSLAFPSLPEVAGVLSEFLSEN